MLAMGRPTASMTAMPTSPATAPYLNSLPALIQPESAAIATGGVAGAVAKAKLMPMVIMMAGHSAIISEIPVICR